MKTTETIPADAKSSPYRVLAWWDVDIYIGLYKERKLRARPLRNLERVLGHRVHGGVHRDRYQLPDGVWKFEGFNYIDVADPAFAAYFVLKQVSGLSEWFSGFGYRPVTSTSDSLDNDTICTFYWQDRDGPETYRHIQSGGVLLALAEKPTGRADRYSRYDLRSTRKERPIVRPTREVPQQSNFLVTMTIHFSCNNRQKLIQHHWPTLMQRYGLHRDDRIEFGPSPKEGEPNVITVSKTLTGVSDHEAVAYCLACTEGCRFKLGGPGEDVFRAEHFAGHPHSDGVFSISLMRES